MSANINQLSVEDDAYAKQAPRQEPQPDKPKDPDTIFTAIHAHVTVLLIDQALATAEQRIFAPLADLEACGECDSGFSRCGYGNE